MPRAWLTCVAVCALAVLTAGLATPSLAQAEDDTVTTTLEPGWNLVGWTEATTSVQAIFDRIPELELVYAWSASGQRFRWAARADRGAVGDLYWLTPGMGLWLVLTGEVPVNWTRPVVEQAGLLFLYEGWNLVAWTGQAEAPANLGLQDLDHILLASADATGVEPTSLVRGGAIWLNVSARIRWGQPTMPASAEELDAIEDLPWVRDGLTDRERTQVESLREIGERSSQAFGAIVTGGWLEEDMPLHRSLVLGDLGRMARVHHRAVALIASLPFLDSLENEDVRVVDALYWIVVGDRARAADFLSVLGSHRNAASLSSIDVWLAYLDFKDRTAADGLRQLAWFHDGIPEFEGDTVDSYRTSDNWEYWTVGELVSIYLRSPRLYLALVQKQWMNDAIDDTRGRTVDRILSISYPSSSLALDILEMPFLAALEPADESALEFLRELNWYDREGLRELVFRYSEGGIADADLTMLRVEYLKIHDPPTAAVLQDLAWLGDGVADSERRAAVLVQRLALEAEPLLHSLVARGWLDDGVSQAEEGVLGQFLGLAGRVARKDIAVAVRISGMPFLDLVDGADAAAMRSLVGIHWEGSESPLMDILDHPTLEGGLADEDTPLVAVLHDVGRGGGADFNKDVALAVLEPRAFKVETRVVPVPGLEEVRLAVVAREGTAPRTLDLLEEAVLDQINFMRTPFPGSFAGLAVVDRSGAGGGGPGGIITIAPGYENSRHLIAHEVAHTYWPFYPPWLAEGPAEFMANRFAGPQLLGACSIADTLGELDRLAQENSDVYYAGACAYTLGSSLFVDLYRAVGDEAFRQGFSRLYLALKSEAHTAVCSGVEKGVCYVKQAFVADASPETAALAEPVINLVYYGDPDGPAPDP